jgi:thioredoxin reductase (NADPH)
MQDMYQLAIIGAGPAGIATAVEGYLQGIRDIVLLEKDQNHNSTIRKFYKDNKRVDKDWKGQKVELDGTIYFVDGTKETTLDFFDEIIKSHAVELNTHVEVQSIENKKDYFEISMSEKTIKAKNVVVTIGRMGKPNKPSYKIPKELKSKIGHTLDVCEKGDKVLVVGGGNSAIEYAIDLCPHSDVTLSYRKAELTRVNPLNKELIKKAIEDEKVSAIFSTNIVGLEEENSKVKVIFEKREPEFYDKVVYAIGGTTPSAFLQSSGIKEENGKPVHDENYETNVKGIFVAGDITQETGGSIALGLNHGYALACHIQKNNKN